MKTAVKVFCALLVVGIVLSGVGFAMGGRPLYHNRWNSGWLGFAGRWLPTSFSEQLNRRIGDYVNDIVDTTISDELDAALDDALGSLPDGYWDNSHYWDDDDHLSDYTSTDAALDAALASKVRKVKLTLNRGYFTIKSSDDMNAPFSVASSEGIRLSSGIKENNTWYADVRGRGKNADIFIYLPEGFSADELDITIGAGVLSAERLEANDFDLEAGAAQVVIDHLAVSAKTDIEIGAGEVTITLSQPWSAYGYDLEAGMGEITLNGDAILSGIGEIERQGTPKISAEVGAGLLSLYTPEG